MKLCQLMLLPLRFPPGQGGNATFSGGLATVTYPISFTSFARRATAAGGNTYSGVGNTSTPLSSTYFYSSGNYGTDWIAIGK